MNKVDDPKVRSIRVRLTESAYQFLKENTKDMSEYVRGLIENDIFLQSNTHKKGKRKGKN